MTLILKLDLDMVRMYHHTKSEVSMPGYSKVIAQMDRQTHTQTYRQTHIEYENITFPHTWAVMKCIFRRKTTLQLSKSRDVINTVTKYCDIIISSRILFLILSRIVSDQK